MTLSNAWDNITGESQRESKRQSPPHNILSNNEPTISIQLNDHTYIDAKSSVVST